MLWIFFLCRLKTCFSSPSHNHPLFLQKWLLLRQWSWPSSNFSLSMASKWTKKGWTKNCLVVLMPRDLSPRRNNVWGRSNILKSVSLCVVTSFRYNRRRRRSARALPSSQKKEKRCPRRDPRWRNWRCALFFPSLRSGVAHLRKKEFGELGMNGRTTRRDRAAFSAHTTAKMSQRVLSARGFYARWWIYAYCLIFGRAFVAGCVLPCCTPSASPTGDGSFFFFFFGGIIFNGVGFGLAREDSVEHCQAVGEQPNNRARWYHATQKHTQLHEDS